MLAMRAPSRPALPPAARPRLELSGPRLVRAFEALVAHADASGGIERYTDALKAKSELFARTLRDGRARGVPLADFRTLCAWMPTVRRRIGPHVQPEAFGRLRGLVADLLDEPRGTHDTDARIDAFCAAFPMDRAHRWVRDLAAELLHQADPERYPAMTRWTWDARANTGVLREIWHGEDVDHMPIDVPDRYETFVVLREELAQFLAGQGVFRDVLFYVDLLAARVYADYVQEHGGSYLRADFSNAEEPMVHVRRLLGLDAIADSGRTRLKAADGTAVVVDEWAAAPLARPRG
jgi:hypothetical protein